MNSETLSAYWWPHENNWGDQFSKVVIKTLSGKEPLWTTGTGGRFMAIGSILHETKPGDILWGTGSWMNDTPKADQDLVVTAVRGPLTRSLFLRYGRPCPEVYGDPAMLVKYMYEYDLTSEYDVGLLPHYIDRHLLQSVLPRVNASRTRTFRYVDITGGIEQVIRETARCRMIVTSSLHGLILGESLGIPTVPVQLSTKVAGGSFKFRDYYLSTGRDIRDLICMKGRAFSGSDFVAMDDFIDTVGTPRIDLDQLLKVCPFNYCGYAHVSDIPRIKLSDAMRDE